MKKRFLYVAIALFSFCAGIGCASLRVLAQDDPSRASTKAGEKGEKNVCCAYVGIYMDELTYGTRERLKFPHETGVLITKIEPGSPAEKAGLAEDDIIYTLNGTKVEDAAGLASLVREQKPGDKVTLVIYREGAEKKVTLTLGKRESATVVGGDFGTYNEDALRAFRHALRSAPRLSAFMGGRLGLVLYDLNADLAEYFNLKKGEGVLVLDVEAETPAAKAGVKAGDVIVAFNGAAVSGAGDIMDALWSVNAGDTLSMEIVRRGARKTVEIEVTKGGGMDRFFVAPFERGTMRREAPLGEYLMRRPNDEAAQLKKEMEALKQRLKELEERLDREERKE